MYFTTVDPHLSEHQLYEHSDYPNPDFMSFFSVP